ncbi:uncharacterized protein Gpdh3 isoform X2 [Drosophila kikkawai]|uniref:Glycerol-3-phosphate dehydrogenase [NAD(+)] n=1 Tax=Drosophila kikkawai TaxID=30033 RepID=A0A6P4ILZ0_DROKI|nr:uncharacterized protein LOC108075545 isoform X2 [Drosophila kikkawai]
MATKLKVCIIGAEGWGTAIASAVSKNVLNFKGDFDERVHIYVYDDPIRNSLLSEVINQTHENVKYLPGIKLPKNLVAVNDLLEAAQNADILIFTMPHTFVKSYCNILAGNVKETAFAVSMIKGLMQEREDEVVLVSDTISECLDIPCYSMMSAQSSMEMAQGKLCEITVGCDDDIDAQLLTAVLQTNNCRVISISDVTGVELCGTLNEIISLGAGFVDGLRLGDNTRVATIHLCVKEMMRFIKTFFPSTKMSTFFETCGIANSVAATYVDKNVNFAQSFITTGKTFEEMEATFLHGRKLLGPLVAAEVNVFLEKGLMQHEFPLFTAIHKICQNEAPPELMIDALRNHPDLSSSMSHLLSNEPEPEHAQDKVDQMLEQVADALPKLRSCLDKILNEANSPNLRNLKVIDDWAQVDETEDIPSQLSAEASKVRDEIQKGNVQVAFKMDASEGGRHVRLLLQESPEKCATESGISSGLEIGANKLVYGHFLDSSPENMANKSIYIDNTMNDSPDVLDLSTIDTSEQMAQEEVASISDEANFKVKESLIKSIRQRIEALVNKDKMENLIAKSRREDENLPTARYHQDEIQSPDETVEMRPVKMNAETDALNEHMLSDFHEQNPVGLRLHDDVEAALDEVPALDQKNLSSISENTELDDPVGDSPKLSEMGGEIGAAWEDIAKHGRLLDVDKAELPLRGMDEHRLATMGDRKPNQNLNVVNVRHFRNKKIDDAGRYEWDWMRNQEVDTDESQANQRDEILSKSDQDRLDKLNVQLQEALQQDFGVLSMIHDDAPNEKLGQNTDLETQSDNKHIPHEPVIPFPQRFPAPKKQFREGTPDIYNQPGSVPPPMRKSNPGRPKKMQPQRNIPPVVHQVKQPDQPDPKVTNIYETEPPSDLRSVSELTESQEVITCSDERPTTPKTEDNRTDIEFDKFKLSRPGRNSNSVIRRGRDRQVDYRGQNPFTLDRELESKLTMDTSYDREIGRDGLSHQRRRVIMPPPFNPPLNPRVPVPQPPFDVRDQEYHTMIARPAINPLAQATKWPLSPKAQKLPLLATIQVKPSQGLATSRPLLQIPSGVPRTPTLTKILCALQIGLLATYLARSKKN